MVEMVACVTMLAVAVMVNVALRIKERYCDNQSVQRMNHYLACLLHAAQ